MLEAAPGYCPAEYENCDDPDPTDPGGPPIGGGGSEPQQPQLQCSESTTITPNVTTKYDRGAGDLFGTKVEFDYIAGGGTGNYSFTRTQTILTASVTGNYQNGVPVNGSNVVGGANDPTFFQQHDNVAQLVDTPGVPLQTPGGWFRWSKPSPLQTAYITFTFESQVTVTSGNQTINCPTMFWTFTLNYWTDSNGVVHKQSNAWVTGRQ